MLRVSINSVAPRDTCYAHPCSLLLSLTPEAYAYDSEEASPSKHTAAAYRG